MADCKWLILGYNLPAEPSRIRVFVWRSLRKMGAANVLQSIWFLPESASNLAALQKVVRYIEDNAGKATLLEGRILDERAQARTEALMNAGRDDEYSQFIEECGRFIRGLDKQTARAKFTFAELKEEEAELDKLLSWHARIALRDLFKASRADEAYAASKSIKARLEAYCEMVCRSGRVR